MNKSYFYFLGFFLNSRKFGKKRKKDKAQNQNKQNDEIYRTPLQLYILISLSSLIVTIDIF